MGFETGTLVTLEVTYGSIRTERRKLNEPIRIMDPNVIRTMQLELCIRM